MRPWSSKETARKPAYRMLYRRTKEQLDRFEDVIDYLIERIEGLQKRIDELENKKESQVS